MKGLEIRLFFQYYLGMWRWVRLPPPPPFFPVITGARECG
jgi:hypothetical protein